MQILIDMETPSVVGIVSIKCEYKKIIVIIIKEYQLWFSFLETSRLRFYIKLN